MNHCKIPPCLRRRRAWSRGAASVEAIIALPVLILLFVAASLARDLTSARHEVQTHARTCAWLYSAGNCAEIPAGCEDAIRTDSVSGRQLDEILSAFGDNRQRIVNQPGKGSALSETLKQILEEPLKAAFGNVMLAETRRAVPRPALFGTGNMNVRGNYRLACNVGKTTLETILGRVWSDLGLPGS